MTFENKSSSLSESHVRLGTRERGAWVPRAWESEARAFLYAMRIEHSPFAKMPTFDIGSLNPLHAIPATDLRTIAKTVSAKAPWEERDVDVTITVGGALAGREVVPIVFLKMNDPMVHVAATSYLASLTKWTFALSVESEWFVAEFRSHKGELLWGVSTPALRDDDSMLIRRYIAVKKQGILSLPLTTSLYDELRPERTLTAEATSTLRDCKNFFFRDGRKVHSMAKDESAKTSVVSNKQLLMMAV